MLQQGTKAPAFTLPDASGMPVSLADFSGKTVVLYFYSKDGTAGCTRQAQAFRDAYGSFLKEDVVVTGISKDTVAAHKKFVEKNNLPFILLSDTDLLVQKAYDVWKEKNMYGKKVWGAVRTTYVIGPDGTIKKVFSKAKPDTNAAEILDYLNGIHIQCKKQERKMPYVRTVYFPWISHRKQKVCVQYRPERNFFGR